MGHTALAFAVVAVVAHVLRIMLLVQMVADKVLFHIDCGIFAEHADDLPPLEVADLVLGKFASHLVLQNRRLLLCLFGKLQLFRPTILRLLGVIDFIQECLLKLEELLNLLISLFLGTMKLLKFGLRRPHHLRQRN